MPPVYKSVPTGPWIKGLNAATDQYSQPKGSFPRVSNMNLRVRGALHTIDGSLIISAAGGIIQPANQGAILALFLFQPIGISPYYVDLQVDALHHLGAPTGLAVADGGAGGTLGAATYYYKVTATDGFGGETKVSSEASIANPGSHKNALTWNQVNNASGYNVYRSTSTGTETFLASVTTNSFTDDGSISQGVTFTLASIARVNTGGLQYYYTFSTTAPTPFKSGIIISVSGVTPSLFNQTYQVGLVSGNPQYFNSIIYHGNVTNLSGTGGTVTGGVLPPATDTTQAIVLRVLPTLTVSYDESSIVAIFPSSPGTVIVNPPGSGGGGGGTGGGGGSTGGGGGIVPGGGGGGGIIT